MCDIAIVSMETTQLGLGASGTLESNTARLGLMVDRYTAGALRTALD